VKKFTARPICAQGIFFVCDLYDVKLGQERSMRSCEKKLTAIMQSELPLQCWCYGALFRATRQEEILQRNIQAKKEK
jgi:hypothetical protein